MVVGVVSCSPPELPHELIDAIIFATDFETQLQLYTTGELAKLVSSFTFQQLEPVILTHFRKVHASLLCKCLQCLGHHVWDDGTPMKNRQVHKIKVLMHPHTPVRMSLCATLIMHKDSKMLLILTIRTL